MNRFGGWCLGVAIVIAITTAGCGDSSRTSFVEDEAGADAADTETAGVDAAEAADADAGADGSGDAGPPPDATDGGPADSASDTAPGADAPADSATDADRRGDGVDDVTGKPDAPADVAAADTPADPCADGRTPTIRAGPLTPSEEWVTQPWAPCGPVGFDVVMPAGTQWRFEARDLPEDARIFVHRDRFIDADLAGTPPEPALASTDFAGDFGALTTSFTAPRSGGYRLVFERDTLGPAEALRVRATCLSGCDRVATRHPIVLVHGYAGVDSYFGVLDYFYDIHDPLEARGYDVFTPVVDAIATSETRAAQLATQVDAILAETGARRLNFIAHSQGGLDVRVLISGLGYADRVATLTTVATPHGGIPIALFDFFSAQDFSPEYMETFNATYVDDPRVTYFSWTARSCGRLDLACRAETGNETIEPLIIATFNLLNAYGPNDGIVPTASMPWGTVLGRLDADHFDEVGQVADLSLPIDPFDHRAFYRDEAARLAAGGW